MKKIFVLVCVLLGFILSAGLTFGAPAITSPVPGTKLTDTTVTFSWDADGYTYFKFYGADHIAPYQSDTRTDTSITIAGIPNDGSPVFVILSYWDGVEWKAINYFYQALGSGAKLPSLTSPSPGADLKSPSQTFQVDFGDYKVDTWMSFYLTIGSAPLEADIFDSGATGDNTFTVNNLPQDNSTLYVTLWYWDGIEFKNIEYTYVSKKFPWTMFLPAITRGCAEQAGRCECIAGCYEGAFTDNCPGTAVTGMMNLTVNADCSFSSLSNYGVQTSGSITNHTGSTYSGSGTTDSNGCGAFSLTCTDTGSSVACNYTYSNGKTGSIPNAGSSTCKPLNRLKTEMLAGSWRFAYQILIMFTSDYYLDLNSVKESSLTLGEYYIYGEDQWGDLVIAGYAPTLGKYDLYDSGITIDKYYTFSFIGNGLITGCYYQIDLSDNSWSSCYPMSGTLLGLSKSLSQTVKSSQSSQEEQEAKMKQEVNAEQLNISKASASKPDQNLLNDLNKLKTLYNKNQSQKQIRH